MNPIANYASILEIMFALFVMAFFSVSSFEVAGSCGNYPIHFKNIYPILGCVPSKHEEPKGLVH